MFGVMTINIILLYKGLYYAYKNDFPLIAALNVRNYYY